MDNNMTTTLENSANEIDIALKILYYVTADMVENERAIFKKVEKSIDSDACRLTTLCYIIQDILKTERDNLYKTMDDLIEDISKERQKT